MACGEDRQTDRQTDRRSETWQSAGVGRRATHKSHTAQHCTPIKKQPQTFQMDLKWIARYVAGALVNISAHQYASESRYGHPDHLH